MSRYRAEVIGSLLRPDWLKQARVASQDGSMSIAEFKRIEDRAVDEAVAQQEGAGMDVITDGELQRDNMIDYFTERLPGVQVDLGSKRFYYDFYETSVRSKLATRISSCRGAIST